MAWSLLPRSSVEALAADVRACHALAELVGEPKVPPIFTLGLNGDRIAGTAISLDHQTCLLALWTTLPAVSIQLVGCPLLSLWLSTDGPSLLALDGPDRANVLKRICQVALRVWDKQPLPESWHAKRIGLVDTVYAGSFSHFTDLRIAYATRVVNGHRLVDAGSLYDVKRASAGEVPATPSNTIERLPNDLAPPDSLPEPLTLSLSDAGEDRDFVIPPPLDAARHLFSLTFDQWVQQDGPLTRQQRRIISHRLQRPLRIHGPAGSGKTLILILKTLSLLREAQDPGQRCHILFVVTSTAVRSTIRAAIEAIDDRLFLATTRGDLQYLDVETLHGWCIRELGVEGKPGRVLERDPKSSKLIQLRILGEVFDAVYNERYERLKDFLSADFRARIDGKREQLLRDLQWEIAIRIKGRGFRRTDRDLYLTSPLPSFIGSREKEYDRHFIFHVYDQYEKKFHDERLLDTDDIVLSMAATLSSSLWDRQRADLGYDYVVVDETHLFNENERRVLPLLTRATTEYPLLMMSFDEAQSIGGRRSLALDPLGITNSERRNLTVVHRCSPDIFALARDLVERSALMFTEFGTLEAVPRMSERELRRCRRPSVVEARTEQNVTLRVVELVKQLREGDYRRIGVIALDRQILAAVLSALQKTGASSVVEVEERGEKLAAIPRPGAYIMTAEACGGLEFDAVLLLGAEEGRVPPAIGDLSAEGYLALREESYKALYTAITRARYVLTLVIDSTRGISELLRPCVASGLLAG